MYLLNYYYRCPNSQGEGSRSPALCLVCGTIVCVQSYCCQTESDGQMVGASTVHSRKLVALNSVIVKVSTRVTENYQKQSRMNFALWRYYSAFMLDLGKWILMFTI